MIQIIGKLIGWSWLEDNWKNKRKNKKNKHLSKKDFEKIQETIKKVDKKFEENKIKKEVIISKTDKEANKKFLMDESNKKNIENMYNDLRNISSLLWDFDRKKRVKGSANVYILTGIIIVGINIYIIFNFNNFLHNQLNYDINLLTILIVINLVMLWIIYIYKKLFQAK